MGAVDDPTLGTVVAYDAVYVKDAMGALFRGFVEGHDHGDLEFHTVPGTELPEPGQGGTVLSAEQSNTSIVFGRRRHPEAFPPRQRRHQPRHRDP